MSTTNEKRSDEVTLPNSHKVYIDGQQPGVRVPFREITQNVTKNFDGHVEENPPVRVYDTSGVWGDPAVRCDVREGLAPLRREWIVGRGDVEEYEGRQVKPEDNGYLTVGAEEYARDRSASVAMRVVPPPSSARLAASPVAASAASRLRWASSGS